MLSRNIDLSGLNSMDLHEIFFTVFGYNQYCDSYNLWLG